MVLSGDRIGDLEEESIKIMKKLLPPTGRAARFDPSCEIGWAGLRDGLLE